MTSMLSSRQRGAIRLAWRFIAPYRGRVLGALLALMFTAAITLSMGQGIKLLVDQGLATQSPAALRQSLLLFFVLVLALALEQWDTPDTSKHSPKKVKKCPLVKFTTSRP